MQMQSWKVRGPKAAIVLRWAVFTVACDTAPERMGPEPGSAGAQRAAPASLASSKVLVCHRTNGRRGYMGLTISSAAVPAHLAHGDGLPGDPVPGEPSAVFGEDCSAVSRPASDGLTASGWEHSCALDVQGQAYCWGSNQHGGLGDGTQSGRLAPVRVGGGLRFTEITAGYAFNCARDAAGAAFCWGRGRYGQLGEGAGTEQLPDGSLPDRNKPVPVTGGHRFTQVTTGWGHACGLDEQGVAYCWGNNGSGQIGDGTQTPGEEETGFVTPVPTPVRIPGDLRFSRLTAGAEHTCGLDLDGSAFCWGWNERGQLGDGTTVTRTTPVAVAGGMTFVDITAGNIHTCALTDSGAAYCWGLNHEGQLGDGSTVDRPVPGLVSGGLSFTQLSVRGHSCGRDSDGVVHCWGGNFAGQLGDGTNTNRIVPTAVAADVRFSQVSAGSSHTCAFAADEGPYCWGVNTKGQLGDGTQDWSSVPVPVAPLD